MVNEGLHDRKRRRDQKPGRVETVLRRIPEVSSFDKNRKAQQIGSDAAGDRTMETELKKAWEEAFSLRGDETNLEYIGTITKSGTDYIFYTDSHGEYWYDSKPEGKEKPEWMTKRRKK